MASGLGAAATLFLLEDAGPGWIVPVSVLLCGLTAGVAYLEVHAGAVFPSDIPVGVVSGLAAGAATVFWHQIFWKGWPVDPERGELPLRLRAIGFQSIDRGGGGGLYARLAFE